MDTNQELLELFQIITAQHFELLQYIATLKAAIGYMMPKVRLLLRLKAQPQFFFWSQLWMRKMRQNSSHSVVTRLVPCQQ